MSSIKFLELPVIVKYSCPVVAVVEEGGLVAGFPVLVRPRSDGWQGAVATAKTSVFFADM
jgi:hypothetical protein